MATKTFNIGEYCEGGTIKAVTKANKNGKTSVKIEIQDYYTRECLHSETFWTDDFGSMADYEIENWLTQYTTSYYACVVIDWMNNKI